MTPTFNAKQVCALQRLQAAIKDAEDAGVWTALEVKHSIDQTSSNLDSEISGLLQIDRELKRELTRVPG